MCVHRQNLPNMVIIIIIIIIVIITVNIWQLENTNKVNIISFDVVCEQFSNYFCIKMFLVAFAIYLFIYFILIRNILMMWRVRWVCLNIFLKWSWLMPDHWGKWFIYSQPAKIFNVVGKYLRRLRGEAECIVVTVENESFAEQQQQRVIANLVEFA